MHTYFTKKCEWEHFNEDGDVMDFLDFSGKLAHSLINNVFLEARQVLRERGPMAAVVPNQVTFYHSTH